MNLYDVSVVREVKNWLSKARTWWLDRNVSKDIAETVLQHINKCVKAAHIFAIRHPEYIEALELLRYHDTPEWQEEDYTPGQISKEEKYRREKAVMERLIHKGPLGGKAYDLWMRFETSNDEVVLVAHDFDKIDAWVQALEYEVRGVWNIDGEWKKMSDFFEYTLSRITNPILKRIYEILLEKRYPQINYYDQYFFLLKCDGDMELYKQHMEQKLETLNS